jgi:hypothetical protein
MGDCFVWINDSLVQIVYLLTMKMNEEMNSEVVHELIL